MKSTTISEIYNILKERKENYQKRFEYLCNQLQEKYGGFYWTKVTEEEKKLYQILQEDSKIADEIFEDFCSYKWS